MGHAAITGVTPPTSSMSRSTRNTSGAFSRAQWMPAICRLDSVAGAANKFPLGSVMGQGGYLVAIGNGRGTAARDRMIIFASSRRADRSRSITAPIRPRILRWSASTASRRRLATTALPRLARTWRLSRLTACCRFAQALAGPRGGSADCADQPASTMR
jgi:hypothetical protein